MYERLRATVIGALLGLTAYIAWIKSRLSRMENPDNWHLSGPMKWFILGGALVGLIGGLTLVEAWLERERGDVFENTVFNALFALALAVFAALIFFSVKS